MIDKSFTLLAWPSLSTQSLNGTDPSVNFVNKVLPSVAYWLFFFFTENVKNWVCERWKESQRDKRELMIEVWPKEEVCCKFNWIAADLNSKLQSPSATVGKTMANMKKKVHLI